MTPADLLDEYHDDVARLLTAAHEANRAATVIASELRSPVERVLRAGTDLVGRSLKSLSAMRKPALVWFGGGAVYALFTLMHFRDNPTAAVWSDLVSPLLVLTIVFCGAPTAVLGWRHIQPVFSRWYGAASDRQMLDAGVELFVGFPGSTQPGKLAGILITKAGAQLGHLDEVLNVTDASTVTAYLVVRLPNGEMAHLLNTRTLIGKTWFNDLEFLTLRHESYGKALVNECRLSGIFDALPEMVRLLQEPRRSAAGQEEGPGATGEALQPLTAAETGTSSTWESLVLSADFKDELQTTVESLRNAKVLRAQGFEPPSSMLLYGPPGTGKTEVARTLANMSGMSFFAAKGSDLKARYVGHSAPLVRALFQKARQSSPAIVFVDEIDVLASRRDADAGEKDRLSDEIVAELLVELDGVVKAEGDVFFMAATNFPEKVDIALMNRFRVRKEVPLPDAGARRHLLDMFLLGKACDVDVAAVLDDIALASAGHSGRDLRNLVQVAAQRAVSRALKEGHVEHVVVSAADMRAALAALLQGAQNTRG